MFSLFLCLLSSQYLILSFINKPFLITISWYTLCSLVIWFNNCILANVYNIFHFFISNIYHRVRSCWWSWGNYINRCLPRRYEWYVCVVSKLSQFFFIQAISKYTKLRIIPSPIYELRSQYIICWFSYFTSFLEPIICIITCSHKWNYVPMFWQCPQYLKMSCQFNQNLHCCG